MQSALAVSAAGATLCPPKMRESPVDPTAVAAVKPFSGWLRGGIGQYLPATVLSPVAVLSSSPVAEALGVWDPEPAPTAER